MSAKAKKYMAIPLEKGIELYLATLETEGKSPRYIGWLKDRLRYFMNFMRQAYPQDLSLPDLEVEHGREFLRSLMARDVKYSTHPLSQPREGKLAIHYIHGCGRALRSFSSWAAEEGYLEENVMQRLKLPPLPKTLPEPLSEEQIRRVERAHRTHLEEFYAVFPDSARVDQLNIDLYQWEGVYNQVRPHQALDYLTPAEYIQKYHPEVISKKSHMII